MNTIINGLARSARLGMAPTLVSNALAALACVAALPWRQTDWGLLGVTILTGLCFLLYGMWENDRVDAKWDARYRPSRPVPSGMISVWNLRIASLIAGFGGLILSSVLLANPIPGATLLVVITLYNWLHKTYGFTVILMGLCRGLWVVLALMIFTHSGIVDVEHAQGIGLYYAASLSLYTIAASIVARGEAGSPLRKKAAGLLLSSMCLHDAVWLAALGSYIFAAAAVLCYLAVLLLKTLKQRTT